MAVFSIARYALEMFTATPTETNDDERLLSSNAPVWLNGLVGSTAVDGEHRRGEVGAWARLVEVAVARLGTSLKGTPRRVGGLAEGERRLAFQLRKHAGDVAHAPVLDDFAVSDTKNVTGGEAQLPAAGRDAVVNAAMNALVDKARRTQVAL